MAYRGVRDQQNDRQIAGDLPHACRSRADTPDLASVLYTHEITWSAI